MAITLEVKMIARQMTHFYCLLFELYLLLYSILTFQDLKNSIVWGLPFALFIYLFIYLFFVNC